jgi:hypothetical protein
MSASPPQVKFELSSLGGVLSFYKDPAIPHDKKPQIIYKCFEACAKSQIPSIVQAFNACEGFGEVAFLWVWYILLQYMTSPEIKCLEIGVYKGRTLAMLALIARALNKNCTLYGVTPLTEAGDKFSTYPPGVPENYLYAIKQTLWTAWSIGNKHLPPQTYSMPTIVKGLSQEYPVICETSNRSPYDIVYIDGCHDYEVVCSDIKHYGAMLKQGGFLVFDDGASDVPHAFGQFLGHPDVAKAIRDCVTPDKTYAEMMMVGHMRVFYKVGMSHEVKPVDNTPDVKVIEPGNGRRIVIDRGAHCGEAV